MLGELSFGTKDTLHLSHVNTTYYSPYRKLFFCYLVWFAWLYLVCPLKIAVQIFYFFHAHSSKPEETTSKHCHNTLLLPLFLRVDAD